MFNYKNWERKRKGKELTEEVGFTFQFFVLVSDLALLPMHGKYLRVRSSWKREEPILAVSRNVPSASPAPLSLEAWVKCLVLSGEQNTGVKEARACKLRGLESDSLPCPHLDQHHSRCFHPCYTISSPPRACSMCTVTPASHVWTWRLKM